MVKSFEVSGSTKVHTITLGTIKTQLGLSQLEGFTISVAANTSDANTGTMSLTSTKGTVDFIVNNDPQKVNAVITFDDTAIQYEAVEGDNPVAADSIVVTTAANTAITVSVGCRNDRMFLGDQPTDGNGLDAARTIAQSFQAGGALTADATRLANLAPIKRVKRAISTAQTTQESMLSNTAFGIDDTYQVINADGTPSNTIASTATQFFDAHATATTVELNRMPAFAKAFIKGCVVDRNVGAGDKLISSSTVAASKVLAGQEQAAGEPLTVHEAVTPYADDVHFVSGQVSRTFTGENFLNSYEAGALDGGTFSESQADLGADPRY